LFGSLAHGKIHQESDIDLAIYNYPVGKIFRLWGKLMMQLDYNVDLVWLDNRDIFTHCLIREKELRKIA